MPSLVWGESISGDSDLRCHDGLELIIGDLEESEQFANQHAYVAFVDEREAEIERASSNTDIGVAQTVQDGVAVSLNRVWLDRNNLVQCVECNVSYVIVPV